MPEDPDGTPKRARLQVRINQIDYTLIIPGDLDNSTLPRAPVLRIYGSSSTGRTACVHVHQVYPYFFLEYTGKISPRHVNHYISKLLGSLNHAIALSLKRNPLSPKSKFIRAIVLVKGVHFYGFHASYSPFLKVLVVDPGHINRVTAILQSGSVMGRRFRIYESHLSYVLQFLSDFGLYGCGILELEDAKERCSEAREGEEEPSSSGESDDVKFAPSSYFRESRLPLEVDVIAPHILNRHRLSARKIHHKLQIPAESLPSEPLVLSVRELWEDERKHRQQLGLDPSPNMPVDLSESSRAKGGEWVSEARWWDEIAMRIERERQNNEPKDGEIQGEWERHVMTTFDSVEAIWEKQYKTWKPANRQDGGSVTTRDPQMPEYSWEGKDGDINLKEEQVEVDISMLSDQEISQLDQEESRGQEPRNERALEEGNETEMEEDVLEEEEEVAPEDMENDVGDELVRAESPANPFIEPLGEAAQQEGTYRLQSPPTPTGTAQPDREGSRTPARQALYFMCSSALEADAVEECNAADVTPTKATQLLVHSRDPEFDAQSLDGNDVEDEDIDDNIASTGVDHPVLTLDAEERATLITARAVQLSKAFDTCKTVNKNRYVYSLQAPSLSFLKDQLQALGLPSKVYQVPHYSKDSDLPEFYKEYAGLSYRLKGGQGIATLEDWSTSDSEDVVAAANNVDLNPVGVGGWEYASHPPSVKEVRHSITSLLHTDRQAKTKLTSQIEGPTQANIYGFKTSPITQAQFSREKANMTIMSLEVFVPTQGDKVPDPESDEVVAVCYAYHVAGTEVSNSGVLVQKKPQIEQARLRQVKMDAADDELDLLNKLIDLVVELDPDILTGWELQLGSWGYLEARAQTRSFSIADLISRAPPRHSGGSVDQWSLRKASTFKVTGRHVLNLWRIMRSEKTLTVYTFENVVFDVLRKRVPKYSYQTLTEWYHSPVAAHTSMLIQHLFMRVLVNLELLEEAETVTKTAEFARVFGVDFFSVISRGSQFKVESFMFRIAKPESFVLISPSRNEVGKQNAAECMPLIMEPASAFYTSPLLVLDFQSLYPSVMIAYNYCYSTCLGRVTEFKETYKFGVVDNLELPSGLLEKLKDHITVAPNGIMYVKSDVRKGLLGRMLVELLETRVMVKTAMKKADKARKRILDARQLSLKYIANVTYGYTSASFSGRMPAVEIADSIVQTGRETLEKAIDVIDSTKKWGARVVYGDTDSVFVYLPGKTKDQAFSIGYEIADVITAMNPAPIKLKFEKVYLPCVLMAKKRYVGFKYENIDDVEPVFDAKGIETVRRDGVLAQRKMVENCLKILFRTQDLSEVKDYCCRSWTKLLENKASAQDFIFAKEVRMGTYSDKGPPPPGAVVAARRLVIDPNDEPQYGDRIPYVIARSTTAIRLVDRALDPLEFMDNSQLQLDGLYYISRVLIPPLARIFNLVGADVQQWFNEMPRTVVPELVSPRKPKAATPHGSPDKINISEHFSSTQCLSCGDPASQSLCDNCIVSTEETIANLRFRVRSKEERLLNAHRICVTCTGSTLDDPIHCISLDCPWFYARRKAEAGTELIPLFEELIEDLQTNADREPELEEDPDEQELEYQVMYELDSEVDDGIDAEDIY